MSLQVSIQLTSPTFEDAAGVIEAIGSQLAIGIRGGSDPLGDYSWLVTGLPEPGEYEEKEKETTVMVEHNYRYSPAFLEDDPFMLKQQQTEQRIANMLLSSGTQDTGEESPDDIYTIIHNVIITVMDSIFDRIYDLSLPQTIRLFRDLITYISEWSGTMVDNNYPNDEEATTAAKALTLLVVRYVHADFVEEITKC